MSLNQIIDKNPISSLVVNDILKLKCESLRSKTYISSEDLIVSRILINPTSSDNLDIPYTIKLVQLLLE